jgi:hypothetical protein
MNPRHDLQILDLADPLNRPPLSQLILTADPANLVAYWPLQEQSGSDALEVTATDANGAYAGSFTLSQPGPADYSRSVQFVGGRVSLAAAVSALDAPFDPALLTLLLCARIPAAATWTDGISRFAASFGVNSTNRVTLFKHSANNRFTFRYAAGGVTTDVDLNAVATLNWFQAAITVDTVADQMKAYFNGSQVGTTQTGLGVWAGALASGFTALADFSSAGNLPWSGYLAHIALWKSALPPAQVLRLAPNLYFPD